MNIPITVARQKYLENICAITNDSGLPAFVIADALEKLLAEVNRMAQDQLAQDMDAYNRAQKNGGPKSDKTIKEDTKHDH